jgi:hypothetical protein
MKKESTERIDDDLRSEYDLTKLRGGVRGKYQKEAVAGMNLVLIDPDLASVFPDAESVNRALRILAEAAGAATSRARHRVPNTSRFGRAEPAETHREKVKRLPASAVPKRG